MFIACAEAYHDKDLYGQSLMMSAQVYARCLSHTFSYLPNSTTLAKITEIFKRIVLVVALPIGMPIVALTSLVGLVSKLVHTAYLIGTRHAGFPVLNAENKGLLKKFNEFFPNVVVVGAINSEDGKETLKQLDWLGISYDTMDQYPRDKVPLAVWSRMQEEGMLQKDLSILITKEQTKASFTPAEENKLKAVKGASAIFLLHRKVILSTLQRYKEAVERLRELSTDGSEEEKRYWQGQKNKYSSIFIFEHNGRLGSVKRNGKVDLNSEVKNRIYQALHALPSDWEYFSLFSNEFRRDLTKIPEEVEQYSQPSLVYPGLSMGVKAFAFSERMYDDLEKLFTEVSENEAQRNFLPIDCEFYQLSRAACLKDKTRCPQMSPTHSLAYRCASASFHAPAGSYASRNYPSADYSRGRFARVKREDLEKIDV